MYQQRAEKFPWLVPAIIAVHVAVATWLNATLNIWIDEYYSVHTTSGSLANAVHQSIRFEGQPPVYFILLWCWRLVNESEVWARSLSTVAVLGFLLMTTKIVRRMFPGLHPAWIIAPIALNPYTMEAATEMRPTGVTMLLSAALVWFFVDGFLSDAPKKRSIWAYGIVAVISLYTQYFLGFLLLANGLVLLTLRTWKPILAYYTAMAVVAVCFVPMALQVPSQIGIHTDHDPDHARNIAADVAYMVERTQKYVWPAQSFGLTGKTRFAFPALIVAGLGAGLLLHRRRIPRELVAFTLVTGILMACFSLVVWRVGWQNVVARHAIPIMVPAYLAVYGVIYLFADAQRRRILYVWTAAIAVAALGTQYTTYHLLAKTGDYKRVAAYIEANEQPNEPILVFPVPVCDPFSYYYKGINRVIPVPSAEDYVTWDINKFTVTSESEIEAALERVPERGDTIWVVTGCDSSWNRPCGWFNVRWNVELVEQFITTGYTVDYFMDFHSTRIRRCTLSGDARSDEWQTANVN